MHRPVTSTLSRDTSVRSLVYLLLFLVGACDSGSPYPESKDERAHVFYERDEFYTIHPDKAIFVPDGYESQPYSFSMRPIGAVVAIPRNHLVVVTHQFQPWARKIYDVATIVASVPDFAPRTKENSESLMKNESLDRLTIILGGLANDQSAAEYQEAVKKGTLILDTQRSSPDVPVYRKSFDTAGREPFFALPNPSKFKSPLGNDIVIVCPRETSERRVSRYPIGDCRVQIALPPSFFPRAKEETFERAAGVGLYYYFNEKHLPDWPALHPRILAFLRGFVQQ
jgi:hypothetical protein